MGFNSTDPLHVQRLRKAHEESRKRLNVFRKNRVELVRQFVGRHYSDWGTSDKLPLNYLFQAKTIYKRKLVANTPQVLVLTETDALRPMAADYQTHLNPRLRTMNLEEYLNLWVDDALFLMGILKVGWCREGQCNVPGVEGLSDWRTYVEPISLDDWVHDMVARKRIESGKFMGHRFTMSLEEAKNAEWFDKKQREKLVAHFRDDTGESQDTAERIGQGPRGDVDVFEETVDLWEYYLPGEKRTITIADRQDALPLCDEPFNGPDRPMGPFHKLSFANVPDNSMPMSIMGILLDLHTLANHIARKLGRQAEAQKTVLTCRPGSEGDAKRLGEANDLDIVTTDNPEGLNAVELGGINPKQLAYLLQVDKFIDRQGGNLSMLGGLAPQSETLGQDQLLAGAGSEQIAAMAADMGHATEGVLQSIAYYEWHDPLAIHEGKRPVPGVQGLTVPYRLTPESREGNWHLLNFQLIPYSLQKKTPQERLAILDNIVMNILLPASAILEAQGITFDFAAYLELKADYANLPELNRLVKKALVALGDKAPQDDRPRKSPVSNRNYTRRSVGVGAGGQQSMDIQQLVNMVD